MKNITIIGIGLIGSSIARDIRDKNKDVIINIVDNSNTALEKSKKLNLGNNYFEKMSMFIDKTEIIFISFRDDFVSRYNDFYDAVLAV